MVKLPSFLKNFRYLFMLNDVGSPQVKELLKSKYKDQKYKEAKTKVDSTHE